eukprot:15467382-Alexandrium_andersonii.AAC.1
MKGTHGRAAGARLGVRGCRGSFSQDPCCKGVAKTRGKSASVAAKKRGYVIDVWRPAPRLA